MPGGLHPPRGDSKKRNPKTGPWLERYTLQGSGRKGNFLHMRPKPVGSTRIKRIVSIRRPWTIAASQGSDSQLATPAAARNDNSQRVFPSSESRCLRLLAQVGA